MSISAPSSAQGHLALKPDLELLHGKRILIVEDEFLVADKTRRELEKHGVIILGPVPSVDLALDLLSITVAYLI
jgi:hypothetical protein